MPRKTVSISATIKKELYNWVLNELKKGDFRNKSHLVEKALEEFMEKRKKG